ncbi:MAG TPA: 3-mercaptopyruvate sulfurtransferase [Methylocella sp.]|nr:3-mercaptopyruvate sulfurtransferase [Methylocella sp.]
MSDNNEEPIFVSTDWLAENLAAPDIAIIDGTFFLPTETRNAKAEYLAAHIPGAVFFDIEAIADHTTNLPHMLPSPPDFARAMSELGFSEGMRFIVYDSSNLQGGARVWWTLRVFGARDVKLLAGGLERWKAEGRSLEAGQVIRAPRSFIASFNGALLANREDVLAASHSGSAQILDARSTARFQGVAAEPRPGLRSGHIPNSLNLPWVEAVADGELKSKKELKSRLEQAGIDFSTPVITTCGSGVTAAILLLALNAVGKTDVKLYDGSWSEWGALPDLPIIEDGS